MLHCCSPFFLRVKYPSGQSSTSFGQIFCLYVAFLSVCGRLKLICINSSAVRGKICAFEMQFLSSTKLIRIVCLHRIIECLWEITMAWYFFHLLSAFSFFFCFVLKSFFGSLISWVLIMMPNKNKSHPCKYLSRPVYSIRLSNEWVENFAFFVFDSSVIYLILHQLIRSYKLEHIYLPNGLRFLAIF